MLAAVELLRQQNAGRIVVAVPTAAPDAIATLEEVADEVVTLMSPSPFNSVGQWYLDFTQVDDHDLRHLLEIDEEDH